MSDKDEKSKSGAPIHRHEAPEGWEAPSYGEEGQEDAVIAHMEKFFGKVANVYHEVISDKVHIDVHIINPTPERNYYTLFTTGMSYLPMQAPEEYADYTRAELMVHLPAGWDLRSHEDKDFWPINWLKFLARFPHKYDTWLFFGHTVPTTENADPFAPGTEMGCMMLSDTRLLTDEQKDEFMETLEFNGDHIYIFTLLPLHKKEMEFKLENGASELLDKLTEAGVTDILAPGRKNIFA
jgi:hypothetical protein